MSPLISPLPPSVSPLPVNGFSFTTLHFRRVPVAVPVAVVVLLVVGCGFGCLLLLLLCVLFCCVCVGGVRSVSVVVRRRLLS